MVKCESNKIARREWERNHWMTCIHHHAFPWVTNSGIGIVCELYLGSVATIKGVRRLRIKQISLVATIRTGASHQVMLRCQVVWNGRRNKYIFPFPSLISPLFTVMHWKRLLIVPWQSLISVIQVDIQWWAKSCSRTITCEQLPKSIDITMIYDARSMPPNFHCYYRIWVWSWAPPAHH